MVGKKTIAIIGLMGVGKTTVGAKLADSLGYYFIDLDQEIEDRENQTVSEIFRDKGEKYFRLMEKNVIHEILSRDENTVLSLGGGAFIDDETREILKKNTTIIWLTASIDEILRRVGNKTNRPLLRNGDKRKILEDLAKKRYPLYAEANFKFDTTFENHQSLIKKIIKTITNE